MAVTNAASLTIAEMREFAEFSPSEQRYIRRSLDIGLGRQDAFKLWARSPVESAAIQAKLDEILRSVADARSGFVGIEHLTDEEIAKIKSALEREVLQVSKGDADEPTETVEELLEACHDPDLDAPAKIPVS